MYKRFLAAWASSAFFFMAACRGDSREPAAPRPSILLVTIDTLRADRIGRGIAPALDRLAASGTRFTAARTAAPLTLPSHATILTGLLPPAHGVHENGALLRGDAATVAQALAAAGYHTAAFVGAYVLDRRFGLNRGFETYDDRIPRSADATERLDAERPANQVVDAAIGWIDATVRSLNTEPRKPFFVWVHLYDPHAPYNPPPEFLHGDPARASLEDRYNGEVAYADAQVARLLERLRAIGALERTMVIVAGDHGEGLGDHGESTHGMLLFDSTLRVPLIVAAPGRQPAQRDDAVTLADVAPTMLTAAALPVPSQMKGRNLLTSAADAGDLYSETLYPRVAGWSALHAVTDGRWKAIRAGSSAALYDLQTDPQEEHDVAAAQPARTTALTSRIDAVNATASSGREGGSAQSISPEAQARLRALGYVGSGAVSTSSPTPGPKGPGLRMSPAAALPNPATAIADWNAFEEALSLLNVHDPSAAKALGPLAGRHPDGPVFQTTYARALTEAGRDREALQVYRKSAERWPTDASLFHDLAVAARRTGLRDEARRAEEAATTLAPASAIAFNGLGLLAADEGRTAEAIARFTRAVELDPNNASYWANLGNARRATHDAAGAESAYRKAIEVDAGSADAANGLGVLLVETGRAADAVRWFERALAAQSTFVEARLNLGIAYQQSGDSARAAEAYRRVLASAGEHPREKEAARQLIAAVDRSR